MTGLSPGVMLADLIFSQKTLIVYRSRTLFNIARTLLLTLFYIVPIRNVESQIPNPMSWYYSIFPHKGWAYSLWKSLSEHCSRHYSNIVTILYSWSMLRSSNCAAACPCLCCAKYNLNFLKNSYSTIGSTGLSRSFLSLFVSVLGVTLDECDFSKN